MALLPAVTADFADGHSVDPDSDESFLDIVNLERLDNRFDFFHWLTYFLGPRNATMPSSAVGWFLPTIPCSLEKYGWSEKSLRNSARAISQLLILYSPVAVNSFTD